MTARPRSAGVTAAATLALLGCGTAFFFWAYFLLTLLNLPSNSDGKHPYQLFPVAFLVIGLVPPAVIAVGIRTGIGLFHLRPWARMSAMIWAAVTLVLCLALIALRPFETFFISDRFVGQLESLKQLIAIAFVILLLPVSVWWLFLFRTKGVKLQFQAADVENREQRSAITSEV